MDTKHKLIAEQEVTNQVLDLELLAQTAYSDAKKPVIPTEASH